jgi:hypothetical protein
MLAPDGSPGVTVEDLNYAPEGRTVFNTFLEPQIQDLLIKSKR